MKPSLGRAARWAVAVLCLVQGGILFVAFLHSAVFVHFRPRLNATLPPMRESRLPAREASAALAGLGALVTISAGIMLISMLREREGKELRRDVVDAMVTPDEKLAIRELERAGGEMTQSDLVRRTGLSKVKVHRVIKRLESLGVVSKYPYGVTNNIKLEKRLYEG